MKLLTDLGLIGGDMGIMSDMTERENKMLLEAGKNGGEYLDDIKKYDLRHLTKDEWTHFLRSVIGKWGELKYMGDYAVGEKDDLDDEIPF